MLARLGRCIVAMSEGVQDESGRPLLEALASGAPSATPTAMCSCPAATSASKSRRSSEGAFPKVRARVDTFGYLPRAFLGVIDPTDRREAFAVGAFAAEQALCKRLGRAGFRRRDVRRPSWWRSTSSPAGRVTCRPAFYDGPTVSEEGRRYFERLLPPRPDILVPFV